MPSVKAQLLNKIEKGKKLLSILIDPDKADENHLKALCQKAEQIPVDLFLIGGSLLTVGDLDATLKVIKSHSKVPRIIFPGSVNQISTHADAILFLSLLSSRNPEMLIGQQVVAAPYIKKAKIEVLSTAYLLIESGNATTASYMSNSNPIPANKGEIAASTALAGEYLGMDIIYMDGGSGAERPVPASTISMVKQNCSRPLFIGGGIDTSKKVETAFQAGADAIVIGNALEKNPDFLLELKQIMRRINA